MLVLCSESEHTQLQVCQGKSTTSPRHAGELRLLSSPTLSNRHAGHRPSISGPRAPFLSAVVSVDWDASGISRWTRFPPIRLVKDSITTPRSGIVNSTSTRIGPRCFRQFVQRPCQAAPGKVLLATQRRLARMLPLSKASDNTCPRLSATELFPTSHLLSTHHPWSLFSGSRVVRYTTSLIQTVPRPAACMHKCCEISRADTGGAQ